ncbi:response regulator [Pseudoalteromonas sp. C2R02]|uniref:ATP-binding protein n=1 Tax=Pseudoalteromonas sp. C2R02 TaxID=2841565 RepID=UPI001C081CF5|nr:ATP-binding protein [Pseudoalteromonas sp. C2R02]MBU2972674.1 response regulator [Pseudoalteromonas sp. C2R02]
MADNEFNELEIVNQISVGLIGIDQDKKVFLWNAWMEQNSALHLKDVKGKALNDIYPDSYQGRLLHAVEQALSQRMPSVLSNVFNRSVFPLYNFSHQLIQQSINIFPINIKDKPCCIIQITDVSAAVAREQALERQVLERKKAEQAKSEFLASMSHEIRTPLNGVLGMLDLLKREDIPEKTLGFVNVAYSSANALLYIVNDVLDFSKIEAGKLDIEQIPFEIVTFLEDVVQFFALTAQEKNVSINLDTSDLNITHVIGDPNRIKQILMNLIANALKFTEVGEVLIKVKILPINSQQAQLVCQVHDTGIGITDAHQSTLFSPFKQADNSIALKYGGTGLGLSIARQLCNLMGGEIEVKSQIGEGSCFSFDVILSYEPEPFNPLILNGKSAIIIGLSDTCSNILKAYLQYQGSEVFISTVDFDAFTLLKTKHNVDWIFIEYNFYNKYLNLVEQFISQNESWIKPVLVSPAYSKHSQSDVYYSINQPIFKSEILELIYNEPIDDFVESYVVPDKIQLAILVVEDNPINQIVIKEILSKLGFDCTLAKDGIEAIEVLLNSNETVFDIIFMDCKMPRLDGFETTEQIRQGKAGQAYQNVQIVALTANAIHTERDRCLDSGMNGFLTKPINVEKLNHTLQDCLNQK